ncbi:MAG: CHAT domain-containing protein [Acidobacteria bacterium]|nr:CHAT domain-containing protein [Acidobacteriota bacterium]MBI3421588.1 CHAT domain-containing protein [Acidobacteriota bacterium]
MALSLGQSLERQMAGGESHSYRLKLEAGQYIRVEVFQYWISVELRLFDPAGNLLVTVKLQTEDGQIEMVSAIAEQSGAYKLEVVARGHKELHSTYKIKCVKQQIATPEDRLLVEADRLQLEAFRLGRQQKWEEAKTLSEQSVARYERVYGSSGLELVEPLKLLWRLLFFKGDLVALEITSKRILAIQEAALGRDHLDVADGLIALANSDWNQGKEIEAKQSFERAMRIRAQLLAPDDMRMAHIMMGVAALHRALSEFTQAEILFRQALAITTKTLGPVSYSTYDLWNNLGETLATQGEYAEATLVWEGAAASGEKYFPGSPVLGSILRHLGELNLDMGNYERARSFLQRALPIYEKQWGAESTYAADLLTVLGRLDFEQQLFESAAQLNRRAILLREKVLGSDHTEVATSLLGLAKVLCAQQKYDEAAATYQRAQQISEKIYGANDWRLGVVWRDWGKLYQARGDYAKAEQLIRRALGSYEQSLGSNHPYVFEAHSDLMALCLAQDRISEALLEQQRAADISEYSLSRNLLAGSENQKLRYLEKFAAEVDDTLSLHTRLLPKQAPALQLAFQTVLRRKGRVLDEMGAMIRLLRQRAGSEGAQLFNQLSDKLAQLSALTTRGAEARTRENYLAQVRQVNEEIEKLQAVLSARSREFRTSTQPVTLQAVQAALPARTALVEFTRFKSIDEKHRDRFEYQYAAYILLPDGTLRWALLGKAETIERALTAWRAALAPKEGSANTQPLPDARKLARQVDALVMQRVRAQLGKVRQVFLAPDGALNLLPFAALIDERGRELVRDYQFIYLTSGRDLLRLQTRHDSNADVLVFAAPDFDDGSGQVAAPSATVADDGRGGKLSRGVAALGRFEPLPSAGAEAQAIKRLWPQAQLFLDKQATEGALKQVHRPQLLHIATHGVFLEDQKKEGSVENPLLRAWLAMAGANQRKSGANDREDGIFTAYEAAALDLWGTKLVVLSACETGLGEVHNGEGVYGLRRALVLAGAEAQLTSLWKVDDDVTKDLMSAYYGKLRAEVGRAAALRQVQLQMLTGPDRARRNPYFWAGFIQLGEWANLKGERAASLVAQRTTRKR